MELTNRLKAANAWFKGPYGPPPPNYIKSEAPFEAADEIQLLQRCVNELRHIAAHAPTCPGDSGCTCGYVHIMRFTTRFAHPLDYLRHKLCEDATRDSIINNLTAERDTAIRMLAEWCVDIEDKGNAWDDWDENYKEASYRPHPLRQLIDAQKALYRAGR